MSHRSALEGGRPTPTGHLFLTGLNRRDFDLPGVKLRMAKGIGPLDSDIRIPTPAGDAFISSQARALLENLTSSRGVPAERRTLGTKGVNDWLTHFISRGINDATNKIRDAARSIAPTLGLESEFEQLDRIIGALLSTQQPHPTAPPAKNIATAMPYDVKMRDRDALSNSGPSPVLAIAAYRCEVAGVPSDSIDIQVRYFASDTGDIKQLLASEPVHSYPNQADELVSWPFVDLLAIEPLGNPVHGREVIGFISGAEQFRAWAHGSITPTSAHRRIWGLSASRDEFPIDIQIGCPYEISASEWACSVQLTGLHTGLADQHGIDSFQALMLAQNLARMLLHAFVDDDGGSLRDAPGGSTIDVERLFSSGVSS